MRKSEVFSCEEIDPALRSWFMEATPAQRQAAEAAEWLPAPESPSTRVNGRRNTCNQGSLAVKFATELTVWDAYELSRRFNLPPGQVTSAWKMFKRYDVDDDGELSSVEYQTLVRSVLRERFAKARDIPREVFNSAVEQGDGVTFVNLLEWMNATSFSESLLLTNSDRFIRETARKFDTSIPDVELVKRSFDKFDTSGDGGIDYEEFKELLFMLLGVKDKTALPESRMATFWRELDADHSGSVDFHEFIPWYLGFFHGDGGISPVEAYYRNIRPVPFAYDHSRAVGPDAAPRAT